MTHNISAGKCTEQIFTWFFAKFSSMDKYMKDQSLHSTQDGNFIVPESLISKVKNQL